MLFTAVRWRHIRNKYPCKPGVCQLIVNANNNNNNKVKFNGIDAIYVQWSENIPLITMCMHRSTLTCMYVHTCATETGAQETSKQQPGSLSLLHHPSLEWTPKESNLADVWVKSIWPKGQQLSRPRGMMCSADLTCSYVASADPTHAGRGRGNENNSGAGLQQVRPANHRKDFSSVLKKNRLKTWLLAFGLSKQRLYFWTKQDG